MKCRYAVLQCLMSVVMLSVVILNIIKLSVMLNVVIMTFRMTLLSLVLC
jgi:hypothetical protein